MIFKTFNSDIDKFSAKIGILDKSFYDFVNIIKKRKTEIKDLTDKGMQSKDAKKQVGSLWSNLFSNKKDLKEQFVDVMPKIDESNIEKSLSKIKDMSKSVAENKKTWQELYDTLPEGEKHLAKLGKEMEGQIITGEDLINANKKARESAIAHNNALKQQTLGAKAATVATKALSVALNMVAMWAISEVIGFVVTGLHSLATASETARENAAGLAKSISSFNENISNNSSKISDLNSRYQELSKGVNNLGENISLSSSEYDEYKNIISQVSDIMPDLTTYFNSQGEAIGFTYRKRATKKYIDYSFCVCK
jgi:methyl-accepting chemotaxis protein